MAEIVLTDATFNVGTSAAPVNLSDHVRSITINYSAEIHDKTAMGSSARRRITGLKDFNIAVEFNQDYAANEVDATLWSYIGSTAKYMAVKAKSSGVDAVNPRFHGMAILDGYTPIGGSIGDLETVSVTFQGDGDLTRSTTST